MIDFRCPICGAPMSVPLCLAGKEDTCPECRGATSVPTASKIGSMSQALLDRLDSLKGTKGLYEMLRTSSSKEIEEACAAFPLDSSHLGFEWSESFERSSRRLELITYLAQILVQYERILEESPDLTLPPGLPAKTLAATLMSRLVPFVESLKDTELSQNLRIRLYDFALALMRARREAEGLACLLAARPSIKEDHEFWILACRFNIVQRTKVPDEIRATMRAAKEIVAGKTEVPDKHVDGAKRMLGVLRKLLGEGAGGSGPDARRRPGEQQPAIPEGRRNEIYADFLGTKGDARWQAATERADKFASAAGGDPYLALAMGYVEMERRALVGQAEREADRTTAEATASRYNIKTAEVLRIVEEGKKKAWPSSDESENDGGFHGARAMQKARRGGRHKAGTRRDIEEDVKPRLAKIARITAMSACVLAAAGFAICDYSHHLRRFPSFFLQADRQAFLVLTCLCALYVIGTFFTRWSMLPACLLAFVGIVYALPYSSQDIPRYWAHAVGLAGYIVVLIGGVTSFILMGGHPATPEQRTAARPWQATAAIVLSLLGPLCTVPAIAGVICGHFARAKIRRTPSLQGKNLADGALFTGYGLLVVILVSFTVLPLVLTVFPSDVTDQRTVRRNPIEIRISADGSLYLDSNRVHGTDLDWTLREALAEFPANESGLPSGKIVVLFDSPEACRWGQVQPVLLAMIEAGARDLRLGEIQVFFPSATDLDPPAPSGAFERVRIESPGDLATLRENAPALAGQWAILRIDQEAPCALMLEALEILDNASVKTALSAGEATGESMIVIQPALAGQDASVPTASCFGVSGNAHHVVYVIDRSVGMRDEDGLDVVRRETLKSMSGLGPSQDFYVILCDDAAPELRPKRLMPATVEYKVRALEFLEAIQAAGNTNLVHALGRAFDVLEAARDDRAKIIFLMTASLLPGQDEVLSMIHARNETGEVQINTYVYGTEDQLLGEVMKRIAAENHGEYRRINHND